MKSFNAIISLLIATAAAAPHADSKRAPVSIKPTAMHTYFGSTGAIRSSTEGHILRAKGQSDESTLLTFSIPPKYVGKNCAFSLTLDYATDYASGSKQFDMFTSLEPAVADTISWPPGNQRDQYFGRMKFNKQYTPGAAEWVQDFTHPGSYFSCPSGYVACELVPVGDADDIYWSSLSTGAAIVVLNP